MRAGADMPPRLLVVGAGFSGAAFAIHLLRDHPALPVEIVLIEERDRVGAGRAYATDDPAHRINVPAGRMSLFAEHPDDLERWLTVEAGDHLRDDPDARLADGRLYPRRELFGRYVAERLHRHAADATGHVRHCRDRAVRAARRPARNGWVVTLRSGDAVAGDVLLLAGGHPSPRTPRLLSALPEPPLVADPWAPEAMSAIGLDHDVLLVGTGLTACDVVASLERRGHRGRITALSRRGLLPRPRTTAPIEPFGDFTRPPARTARALVGRVRRAVDDARAEGRPWEDVVAALRAQGGPVWRGLPLIEQRRLLRHARPFWDVHRFQSAPPVDAAIARARDGGRFAVATGRLVAATADGDGRARVHVEERRHQPRTITVDRVVDCTGPGHRSVVADDPLLRSLAAAGLLRADATRLGIDTDTESRALDADGRPVADLLVLGPLARAAHGELMGLPQVSAQPRAVAALIAATIGDLVRSTGERVPA